MTLEEVHVWYRLTGTLDGPAETAALQLLSSQERQRRSQFRHPHDRRDYTVAHALLRSALSYYTNVATDAWAFHVGVSGKPELSRPTGSDVGLTFNLAHTRGLVACAIAPGLAVGIDVVDAQPGFDCRDLTARYLSAGELADLDGLPVDHRPARFMELWALKEAYVKATGQGLSQDLSRLSFHIDNERLQFLPSMDADVTSWQFALFNPTPHVRIAVGVELPDARLRTIRARSAEDGSDAPVTRSSLPQEPCQLHFDLSA